MHSHDVFPYHIVQGEDAPGPEGLDVFISAVALLSWLKKAITSMQGDILASQLAEMLGEISPEDGLTSKDKELMSLATLAVYDVVAQNVTQTLLIEGITPPSMTPGQLERISEERLDDWRGLGVEGLDDDYLP